MPSFAIITMRYVWSLILIMSAVSTLAETVDADTLFSVNQSEVACTSVASDADTIYTPKQIIIQKIIRYFDDSNKPPSDKKIDFSLIGGPAYSSDTKLSLGILGAALYTAGNNSSTTSQSNATLYTEFSITGYYNVGIRGTHFTPYDSWRFNYKMSFSSMPTYFWGIGFDSARQNDNKTKYLQLNAEVKASFDYSLPGNCYVGPALHFNYTRAKNAEDYALWNNEHLSTFNYGVGVNLYHDSRDCLTAPHRGWYIGLEQRFYPRFLSNKDAFSSTDVTICRYFGAWRDAIVAIDVHGLFTYGNTPWSMLASVGGSRTMRGYYEGRYRDKNAVDVTVELRQHIWHRNSAVVWVGAGSVFPEFKNLQSREILPNFGVGYRWEFKKNVNVRLDFGLGKGESGIVFNLNEAF